MLLRHYNAEFIKQVLPKFYNPVNPNLDSFVKRAGPEILK